MTATEPTTPHPTAVIPADAPVVDPALAEARWRLLRGGVVGATIGSAFLLAAIVFLAGKPDWWRGYVAATISIALAAAASLVPLRIGVRGNGPTLVQMFMISSGLRGLVAVGLCAVAVAVGHYPAIATLGLLVPYYFALLAAESACLVRGLKMRA